MRDFTLPPEAVARLQNEAARHTPQTLAGGALSVNEAALLIESGYMALGQVMGCSVFQIGAQWTSGGWKNSDRQKMQTEGLAYELTVATQALYQARHRAMSRLKQEAQLLGASGVAAVTLTHRLIQDEVRAIEFMAVGTAIREKGRAAAKEPFLSNLAGADLWKLHEAGFAPVGLCVGNCSYWMIADWQTQRMMVNGIFTQRGRQNQELPFFTRAIYEARELAMSRMENEARACGATGIVGADVEVDAGFGHEHTGSPVTATSSNIAPTMVAHFLAIGTAIAPRGAAPDLTIEQTLSLK